jgi:uncharacterized protein YggU (UPF0235/DUF167 family)
MTTGAGGVIRKRMDHRGPPSRPDGVLGQGTVKQTGRMRAEIHVRPSASTTVVGGEYDGALVVRVVEPADGGRATDAALRAVAEALTMPRRSVTLVRGATSRRKLIEIETPEDELVEVAMARLRGHTDA